MKNITTLLLFVLSFQSTIWAQDHIDLPTVYINENVSTHFTSRNKIDYTDLSTSAVTGDLPMENILRIKPIRVEGDLGYITIVGEHFFYQFKLVYSASPNKAHKRIDLDAADPVLVSVPTKTGNYINPNYSLTTKQLEAYGQAMLKEKAKINTVIAKEHQFIIKLNNIWIKDDLMFFDYTAKNKTNIPYTIDEIRYKVVDQKLVKAESNQDQILTPVYTSNNSEMFGKKFRNVVAIKKFTFPEDKTFIIHIAEDQLSGRNVTLHISYSDILRARTFKTI